MKALVGKKYVDSSSNLVMVILAASGRLGGAVIVKPLGVEKRQLCSKEAVGKLVEAYEEEAK